MEISLQWPAPSERGGRLSNIATTATLLFFQYTYKYITIPHILQKIRDRKKENFGSKLRCNASELV